MRTRAPFRTQGAKTSDEFHAGTGLKAIARPVPGVGRQPAAVQDAHRRRDVFRFFTRTQFLLRNFLHNTFIFNINF